MWYGGRPLMMEGTLDTGCGQKDILITMIWWIMEYCGSQKRHLEMESEASSLSNQALLKYTFTLCVWRLYGYLLSLRLNPTWAFWICCYLRSFPFPWVLQSAEVAVDSKTWEMTVGVWVLVVQPWRNKMAPFAFKCHVKKASYVSGTCSLDAEGSECQTVVTHRLGAAVCRIMNGGRKQILLLTI